MQLNSITIMDLVAFGGAALGIGIAVWELQSGTITLQAALMTILLAAEFFLPMRTLGSFFHIAMNGMAASDKIFRLIELPAEKSGEQALVPIAVSDHLCECVVFLRRGTDGRLESEYALAAGQLYRHRRSQRLWEEHERCFADGRAGRV